MHVALSPPGICALVNQSVPIKVPPGEFVPRSMVSLTKACLALLWLQPEHDGETMCSVCEEGHSTITPCENVGGSHSELTKSMGIELTASAVETDRPFRWVSYEMQAQKSELQVSVPKMLKLSTANQRRSAGTWAHSTQSSLNSLYDSDD